jgi:hypothetical protein
MADNTTEQLQYDQDLAALNAMAEGGMRVKAKEAFDLKYPAGRPGSSSIRQNLGIGEALLGADSIYKDELQSIFDLWKQKKYTEAQDAFVKTKFAKLSSDARNRYLQSLENTELYKQDLKAWKLPIQRYLMEQGLELTDQQLDDYYKKGTASETIFDDAVKGFTLGTVKPASGEMGAALKQLQDTATANGVDLQKNFGGQLQSWLQKIASGQSVEDYKQIIRGIAGTGLPPTLKAMVEKGTDVGSIYSPYKELMANVLGINAETISMYDPTLRSAITDKGEMSLFDFQRALRKDSRWQYTADAKDEISKAVLNIGRDFGFMG